MNKSSVDFTTLVTPYREAEHNRRGLDCDTMDTSRNRDMLELEGWRDSLHINKNMLPRNIPLLNELMWSVRILAIVSRRCMGTSKANFCRKEDS